MLGASMKVIAAVILTVIATVAYARAGTLVKCDFISTNDGPRYVGTYCIDFNCQYVERVVFTSYCPFIRP
jgi:hypothetical protein